MNHVADGKKRIFIFAISSQQMYLEFLWVKFFKYRKKAIPTIFGPARIRFVWYCYQTEIVLWRLKKNNHEGRSGLFEKRTFMDLAISRLLYIWYLLNFVNRNTVSL